MLLIVHVCIVHEEAVKDHKEGANWHKDTLHSDDGGQGSRVNEEV